jgi:hypothetical protein
MAGCIGSPQGASGRPQDFVREADVLVGEVAVAPRLEIFARPTRRETASFESGPSRSSGANAPLIRRVFVPAKYTPRIASSTRPVRR